VHKVVEGGAPEPLDEGDARVVGRARPVMKQDVRAIDWKSDTSETVLRKIRAADGHPGVLDEIAGVDFHLFGGHRERGLRGAPGEIIAQRHGAICRTTVDGAVWISQLRRSGPQQTNFKLPATLALTLAGRSAGVREVAAPPTSGHRTEDTYRDIFYEEHAGVGYLHFDFYNGAMSTEQCRRLRAAYLHARSRRQTKVIVLMGGSDYFSNGIHLNVIEAADDPPGESWRNLHAINDVVREIVETESHLVISALAGDAAAGGVPLALAADRVYAREDVVLNPYYRHMGGLYGSEYWTYLLPRRVGAEMTARLTGPPFTPLGTAQAVEIGLLDAAFGATAATFRDEVRSLARRAASEALLGARLDAKRRRRARDERAKPLRAYRAEEMARAHQTFFGPDPSYHEARRRFTRKLGAAETTPEQTVRRLAA
jgi:putative two-component system protein, hydrogenase maturation factor HypX/HoxX